MAYRNIVNGSNFNDKHEIAVDELRLINPAIYIEPLEENDKANSKMNSNQEDGKMFFYENCGDGSKISDFHHLSLEDNSQILTVSRSQSDVSMAPSSTTVSQCKTSRVERRCRFEEVEEESFDCSISKRYSVNGDRVQVFTSLSSSSIPRQQAHEEWMRKKNIESFRQRVDLERSEIARKAEEERLSREREKREQREHENFLLWTAKKNLEERKKRKLVEKERKLKEKWKEWEEEVIAAKQIYLLQWSTNKNKEQKVQKEEQDRKHQEHERQLKQLEEEKKMRLDESVRAFKEWRERSKSTPRPATQGLLPHQKAKPTYVNPVPWVDDTLLADSIKTCGSNSVRRRRM